ncbi:hypothetical protein K431DRAFT_227789 [Polychaeton citri CBS 116435]|uniref:C2H2-type domain-containing protein n=1 Tax=Polychaeton citri CBS 116435 TaxID=1314669 RepID=A0A9P4Q591_9PEZI|nr:hypothetical protein K431DRAFT_227789 [Polychaeton citri CBS 116435]
MVHNLACPFCGYRSDDEYVLTFHIEERHTESSPFVGTPPKSDGGVKNQREPPGRLGEDWIQCTRTGCGEFFLVTDLEEHLVIHESADVPEGEDRARQDTVRRPPRGDAGRLQRKHISPSSRSPPPPRNGTLDKWFRGSSFVGNREVVPPLPPRPKPKLEAGRLGKRELGPHAFESRMPDRVRQQLIHEALPRSYNYITSSGRVEREYYIENETLDLVDTLADLSALDRYVKVGYFCRPTTKHIRRIHCEGNFCGYWNIQMLLSSMQSGTRGDLLPNVLQIQDTIEAAWDAGLCTYSRTETGGIKGTRKWIGSMEATAYFTHTGTPVSGQTFLTKGGSSGDVAHEKLLDHIEAYFMSATDWAIKHGTSFITDLAPVYLQRQGHSLTIVGLQRCTDGYRDLLVFDPSIETARAMRPLLDGRRVRASPEALTKPYRRSERHLSMWKEFEIVQVDPPSV